MIEELQRKKKNPVHKTGSLPSKEEMFNKINEIIQELNKLKQHENKP